MTLQTDTILKIAPGVWIRNAVDNCLWADLGNGVVVVDALEDRSMCSIIPDDVMATAGKPMRWLINTHADTDHIACNGAWAGMGAEVIAHQSVADAMEGRPGSPTVTFQDQYTVEGAQNLAECEWVGGAHSPADTLVYFPWARVLHLGDLFLWGMIPLNAVTPESVARLTQVLHRVLDFETDAIVCGHGPVLSADHLRRWLEYFQDLLERVPAARAEGLPMERLSEAIPPPEDMRNWWRFVEWKHRRNLELVFKGTV